MNTKQVVLGAVILIIVGFAGWWLVKGRSQQASLTEQNQVSQQEAGMGAQVFEQVSQNPAQKMPETNPFTADTNPYSGAYKNPFGQ